MKTLFKQPFPILVATIVTTVTLAACSNEMHPTDVSVGKPQTVAVHFTTPSAGQAEAETPWQENDQVTVTPQAEPFGAITFEYTKQTDGSYAWRNIVAEGDNYLKAALPASFTAYCPTTADTSSTTFTLPDISGDGQTGQADQSDAPKLHAADYMTATTTVAYGDNVLNLTLAHRLCRLTFVVAEYGDDVPTPTEVKIKSQNQTVNLTDEGEEVKVNATGKPVWISPLIATTTNDQTTYTAIVTPCPLVSGTTELMSLTVDGTLFQVKYKGNLTALASGNGYTFHLKVSKDYVTVMASDATGWTGEKIDVKSKEVTYFTASNLKIGDYYYSDGTISDGGLRKLYSDGAYQMENIKPNLSDSRTVLGIVMKVGRDDDGDWKDDCDYYQKDGKTPIKPIRGYVLALDDATTCYETTHSAPATTSGWFLPSAGQCQYWYNNKEVLLESIKKTPGNDSYQWGENINYVRSMLAF